MSRYGDDVSDRVINRALGWVRNLTSTRVHERAWGRTYVRIWIRINNQVRGPIYDRLWGPR